MSDPARLNWFLKAHPNEVIEAYAEDGSLHEAIAQEIEALQVALREFDDLSRSYTRDTVEIPAVEWRAAVGRAEAAYRDLRGREGR